MKKEHVLLLSKAQHYYEKARSTDVPHIKWLIETIPKIIKDKEILELLIPLAILHDVGYSKVPKGANPYDLKIRKLHSIEGAKITKKILKESNYSSSKIKEIVRLVRLHDDWAFGNTFKTEPILKIFNNFDFMWQASKERFDMQKNLFHKDLKEWHHRVEESCKKNKEGGRDWANKNIADFYKKLMIKRKKEVN